MPKFNFIVNQTDHYQKNFTVEGDTEEEAKASLEKELDECPLDTQSNTFESCEILIELEPKKNKKKK